MMRTDYIDSHIGQNVILKKKKYTHTYRSRKRMDGLISVPRSKASFSPVGCYSKETYKQW